MSESGRKIIQGATEALAVACGSAPAHAMTINGHTYYSEPAIASWGLIELMVRNPELSERVSDLEARLEKAEAERDAAIEQAYLLGFANSGEGWNGEFPFDVERPDMNDRWLKSRDEVLSTLKSKS